MTSRNDIARHYVEYLREHPDVCAWLSVRAGMHPYVRFDPERDAWLVVESVGFGELEVEIHDDADAFLGLLASNPVDLVPVAEAESHGPGETVWDQLDSGEKVTVIE